MEVIAAIVGAVIAGAFGFALSRWQTRLQREADRKTRVHDASLSLQLGKIRELDRVRRQLFGLSVELNHKARNILRGYREQDQVQQYCKQVRELARQNIGLLGEDAVAMHIRATDSYRDFLAEPSEQSREAADEQCLAASRTIDRRQREMLISAGIIDPDPLM